MATATEPRVADILPYQEKITENDFADFISMRKQLHDELITVFGDKLSGWAWVLADEASRLHLINRLADAGVPEFQEVRDRRAILKAATDLLREVRRMPEAITRSMADELAKALVTGVTFGFDTSEAELPKTTVRALAQASDTGEVQNILDHALLDHRVKTLRAVEESLVGAWKRFESARGWDDE